VKVRAVDLFCGVGGLTRGLIDSGIDVIAGVDIDSSCKFPYETNNSSKFINKSVDEFEPKEIINFFGKSKYTVLAGCAPCQPFSKHQKNKYDRSKHKDWSLLYSFLKQIRIVRPTVVSMENVPELQNEVVFHDFINGLHELNYFVSYSIVDASNYGVPQKRYRLLLLASLLGEINLIPPTHKKPITVREAISDLPQIKAGEKYKGDILHYSSKLSETNLKRIKNSNPGGTWTTWPDELKLSCHKKNTGSTYKSVYGRMEWDKPSPTLTTQFHNYGTGRYGHPEQDRAISLREGAILQSFPTNYQFIDVNSFNVSRISRHIGNAVPPKLGEIIGRSIRIHIKEHKKNARLINNQHEG